MMRTAVWPSSWNIRRTSSTTRWPTWMSGAVGSMPSLTRSLSPASRRRRRFASSWISTARSRNRCQSEGLPLMLDPRLLAVEVARRVLGDHGQEDELGEAPQRAEERRSEDRLGDGVVDLDLGAVRRSLVRLRGIDEEAQRDGGPEHRGERAHDGAAAPADEHRRA